MGVELIGMVWQGLIQTPRHTISARRRHMSRVFCRIESLQALHFIHRKARQQHHSSLLYFRHSHSVAPAPNPSPKQSPYPRRTSILHRRRTPGQHRSFEPHRLDINTGKKDPHPSRSMRTACVSPEGKAGALPEWAAAHAMQPMDGVQGPHSTTVRRRGSPSQAR